MVGLLLAPQQHLIGLFWELRLWALKAALANRPQGLPESCVLQATGPYTLPVPALQEEEPMEPLLHCRAYLGRMGEPFPMATG